MTVSSLILLAGIVVIILIVIVVVLVSKGGQRGSGSGGGKTLAAAHLIRRAEKGDMDAQKELGYIYALGAGGVCKNLAEAVVWYEKAARRGDAEAQNALGILYAKGGEGLMQNHRKAALWYEKAAEKGLAQAQINYGTLFEYGQGVIKSYITAYMWYTLAFEHADTANKELLHEKTGNLSRSMTQNQIMEARKRARDLRSGMYKA